MSQNNPTDDEDAACRVAALPLEYGPTRINQLFTRGYNRYVVDGEDRPEDLLNDIERFGTAAFKQQVRADATEEPFVDEPGTLAVLATLSAICVKEHPKFEHASPRNIQILYDIRELYVNNLASLIRAYGDGSLQQDIADVLYSKEPGEDGSHPGGFVRVSQRCRSSGMACTSKSRWLRRHGNVSFEMTVRRRGLTAERY